jgi:hypothetical protein
VCVCARTWKTSCRTVLRLSSEWVLQLFCSIGSVFEGISFYM